VENVKSVQFFAPQDEVVYLEISRPRLAQFGINEEQIAKLQERNIAAGGGRVCIGDQHIALDPYGAFSSAYNMLVGDDAHRAVYNGFHGSMRVKGLIVYRTTCFTLAIPFHQLGAGPNPAALARVQ